MTKGFRWGGATLSRSPANHVARHASIPGAVNASLHIPPILRRFYDQGPTSECVAFSTLQLMSLANGRLYHSGSLFYRGGANGNQKLVLDAAKVGLATVPSDTPVSPTDDDPNAAISTDDRIASWDWFPTDPQTALDQARSLIANGRPFLFAFGFWSGWQDTYTDDGRAVYIGPAHPSDDWGHIVSYHQLLVTGAHDDGSYIESPNSWGTTQPMFRFTYSTFKECFARRECVGIEVVDAVTGSELPLPEDQPSPTPSPVFTCNRCGRTFPSKKKLKRHKLLAHRKRSR